MFEWLGNIGRKCLNPVQRYVRLNNNDNNGDGGDDGDEEQDNLLWEEALQPYVFGDYSFAVVQGNSILEDHSLVESGRDGIFVGVYDGHAGPQAAVYVADHLFLNFSRLYSASNGTLSEDILRDAFRETENGFLENVRINMVERPFYPSLGTCSLVGVIQKETLYVANAGDSRAVLGFAGRSDKIIAEQLTTVHNANVANVREELKAQHPQDRNIVVQKNGSWRVKGIIQVTKAIGDFYLKFPNFEIDHPRFRLPEPLADPVLTAEPSVYTRPIRPQDRFLIFASDGLWDYVNVAEAVEIVAKNEKRGIARRLIIRALEVAARKHKMTYAALKRVGAGDRRRIHDDITVVVVFIDQKQKEDQKVSKRSVRGFGFRPAPSGPSQLWGSDVASSSSQGNVDASCSTERIAETSSSSQGNADASCSTERIVETSSSSQGNVDAPCSTERIAETSGSSQGNIDAPCSTDRIAETSSSPQANVDAPCSTERIAETSDSSQGNVDAPCPTEKIAETSSYSQENIDALCSTERIDESLSSSHENVDAPCYTERIDEPVSSSQGNVDAPCCSESIDESLNSSHGNIDASCSIERIDESLSTTQEISVGSSPTKEIDAASALT